VTALIVALAVLGFVIPAGAAAVAYRRARAVFSDPPPGTWETVKNIGTILETIYGAQIDAVKWPVIWALVGIACGAAASILSVLAL